MIKTAILLGILSTTAQAQSAMTGEEFDAYTLGTTLTYQESGQTYGIEQYLSGRRVTWAFADGDCQYGRWTEPEPAMICFVYDGSDSTPQCWNFFKTATGIRANFINSEDGRELYEARRSVAPLLCMGPEVGV